MKNIDTVIDAANRKGQLFIDGTALKIKWSDGKITNGVIVEVDVAWVCIKWDYTMQYADVEFLSELDEMVYQFVRVDIA